MNDPVKFTKQEWVYIGRRAAEKGYALDVFIVLNDGALSETRVPYKAARSRKIIGGVYEVDTLPDQSRAHVKGARFVRMFENEATRLEWKVESDTYDLLSESAALERKHAKDTLAALEPVRKMYWDFRSAKERRAFEVLVLGYLRQEK